MNPEFLGPVAENSKRGKAVRRAQPKDVENLNDGTNSGRVVKNSKRRKAVRRAQPKDVENLNDVTNSVRSLHLDDKKDEAFGIKHAVFMEVGPPVKAKVRESGEREQLYRLYMGLACPKEEDDALEYYAGVMSLVMGSREKALSVLRENEYRYKSFIVGLTDKEATHLFITKRGNKDISDKIKCIYDHFGEDDWPFIVFED